MKSVEEDRNLQNFLCSFTGPEDFCVRVAGHVSSKDSTEGFRHSCYRELLSSNACCQKGKEEPKGKGALVRLSRLLPGQAARVCAARR